MKNARGKALPRRFGLGVWSIRFSGFHEPSRSSRSVLAAANPELHLRGLQLIAFSSFSPTVRKSLLFVVTRIFMDIGKRFLAPWLLAGTMAATAYASPVNDIHADPAGKDIDKLRLQVQRLADLAKAEIVASGVDAATKAFREAPWKRDANGLHLWGITTQGISWFDAGHPELEGLNVSEMSDLQGRNWSQLALNSANGSGQKIFEITFPHPTLKSAARGVHSCFQLERSERVLCAGAFLDGE
jgi:hypothetical protein